MPAIGEGEGVATLSSSFLAMLPQGDTRADVLGSFDVFRWSCGSDEGGRYFLFSPFFFCSELRGCLRWHGGGCGATSTSFRLHVES